VHCIYCGCEIHGSFKLLDSTKPICFGCATGEFEDHNFDVILTELEERDDD